MKLRNLCLALSYTVFYYHFSWLKSNSLINSEILGKMISNVAENSIYSWTGPLLPICHELKFLVNRSLCKWILWFFLIFVTTKNYFRMKILKFYESKTCGRNYSEFFSCIILHLCLVQIVLKLQQAEAY